MQQTPVHDVHNADLLALVPPQARRLVEVGCSSGALAREYKRINPACHYTGIEISPEYAALATRHCDRVIALDIEAADDAYLSCELPADTWIFGDCLEHLREPWQVLSRIRSCIPADGSVVACIPNAQHWSVQARLSIGDFRYEDSGLFDRTHLRWFTRQTILELFDASGFEVVAMVPRIFGSPDAERFIPAIREMALAAGHDPNQAEQDALPLQYVVRAVPKASA